MVMAVVGRAEADRRPCPLLLISVMHSGTRFFEQLIKPSHIKHLHQDTAIEKVINRAGTVVCAIRKPEKVLESWYKRHNGRIATDGRPNGTWAKSWKVLDDVASKNKIFFLPIDHDDRDEYLAELGTHLGRTFEPDWDDHVGFTSGHVSIPKDVDLKWIYDIPIVKELYGNA